MAATLSRGQTFGVTETVTNTKLHNLVDLATISGISNSEIASDAAIVDTKLADITTGSKVRGIALGNLASIPAGAGIIPQANLNAPFGASYVSLISIPNLSLLPLTLTSWVDGAAMRNVQSIPTLAGQLAWYSLVTSLASGGYPQFNGGGGFVGAQAPANSFAAGAGLLVGDDDEETATSTSSANPSIKKLYVPKQGELRLSVDLKSLGGDLAIAQIYRIRSGASTAVGVLMTNASSSYLTRTQDITSWLEGDFVGMNLWSGAGATITGRNLRIFVTKGA